MAVITRLIMVLAVFIWVINIKIMDKFLKLLLLMVITVLMVSVKIKPVVFATAGWKFNPHWQLIGRVDQFDPNRDVSNDLRREYTIGLNWFY